MTRFKADRCDPESPRCAYCRAVAQLCLLAAGAALVACAAADDEASGPPVFGATPPSSTPGDGSPTANMGATPNMGTPGSNNPGFMAGGVGGTDLESVGGTGTPVVNGGGGAASMNGSAGSSGMNAGGSAAMDNGGAGSTNMAMGGMPANGGSPNEPPPPTGPDIECPPGASFCSGFEGTEFPAGTRFHAVGPGSQNASAFDASEAFAGEQSLSIPATGSGGFFYRALAVPVPGQDFWARLYLHSSTEFGDNSHDSVFGASSGGLDADVNGEALVELSEQFGKILLNTDDALFQPEGTVTLPANTWLCMEAHYNGNTGDVQIFQDGELVIDAPGYRQVTYQTFRIGYMRYNDDRTIRFDDVVVAPQRVGCD